MLLAIIFVVEVAIMLFLDIVFPTYAGGLLEAIVDALLLVVVLIPVVWWMLVRPLQNVVVSEHTGLGLSTVYGIVKQSQGFMWVYSELGRGTSFKIYLPLVTEAAAVDRPQPVVVSGAGAETILLVEDNLGLRKVAMRILEPAGYTVLRAATGEEALQVLERYESPVHLLLSDVVMPDMGGRQLAERLAQTHPAMKVLYMSGYTSDTVVRHGVLDAQMPFLSKPFTAAALLRKVREVLDTRA